MNDLLIYLLKSAGLLSIFYLAYQVLLKKDTAFKRNRKFLLGGIFAAALLPAITFTRQVSIHVPVYLAQFQSTVENKSTIPAENAFDWWQLAGIVYSGVFGILIIRFFFQMFSLAKLIANSPKIRFENYRGIETNMKTSPFSFFNVIVFNPNLHSEEELKLILSHEKVHARQKHSIDILLANLVTILLWFNPLSWMYKKNIEQNLEFLADKEAAHTAVSKSVYQKALLRVTISSLTPSLSNNFYQSSIKKRIIMLNKNPNSKNNSWKIASILPVILAFMFIFSCSNPSEKAAVPSEKPLVFVEGKPIISFDKENPLIIVDGAVKKDNFNVNSIPPTHIAKVDVLKGKSATDKYGEKGKKGAIEITLKNGRKTGASGENSINASDALFVIDGKIMKDDFNVNSINPEDIESIDVLKGKSATEKYGREGEKGAILISLKKD